MKKNLLSVLFAFLGLWMCNMQAHALTEVGGVYQIANADDLQEFSDLVADGQGGANAVLTADIDLSGYSWLPIGSVYSTYYGTFDGQEHRIMNMIIDTEDEYQGLFGVLSNGAHIKNVIIDSSCSVHGARFVGGIAGGSNGKGSITIECCGNEGEITATEQNAAGIIGVSMNSECGFIIRNCYNAGFVGGARECAAISGWCGNSGSVVENCYNLGTIDGVDGRNYLYRNGNTKASNNYCNYEGQGTFFNDYEYLSMDGSLCYLINGNQSSEVVWYQNLDNGEDQDFYPVPFSSHGVVYAIGTLNCDGTPATSDGFSNTNQSIVTPHNYYNGVCQVCGYTDMGYTTQSGGYYELSTPEHLNWFAAAVKFGHNEIKGKLMNDIDFSKYTQMDVTIGMQNPRFKGAFDGQEHTITVKYNCSHDTIALFRCIEDATIERLVVAGEVKTSRKFGAGLFAAGWGTNVIKNCIIKANLISTFEGDSWENTETGETGVNYDATHGGLCCFAHGNCTILNCAVLGDIDAELSEGSAAVMGYPNGGSNVKIQNCFIGGTYILSSNNALITRNNGAIVENCYYLDTNSLFDSYEATAVTAAQIASGELAFLLNESVSGGTNWYQNIGSDDMPVPFNSHRIVYAVGTLRCDGTPDALTYTNTNGTPERPNHKFDADGICENCGARLISTADQLFDYAADLNVGAADGSIEIILANDINMKAISGYTGIGTRDYPFSGSFDGKGHRITNMLIDAPLEGEGGNNIGLFGVVGGETSSSVVTIKNVVIDSSCEIFGAGYAAGIVGCAKGKGKLIIENCGNEAPVTVEGANAAGILGVDDLGGMLITIRNCYNTGEIVGGRESAGISGWLGKNAVVENCYNTGDVAGLDGTNTFGRSDGGSAQYINCYETIGSQVVTIDASKVSSGELCWLLNGKVNGGEVFFQTIGTDDHPIFDPTHGKVYEKNGTYTNTATAIEAVEVATKTNGTVEAVFSANGTRQAGLQRGINIVKMSNGQVRKVIVK